MQYNGLQNLKLFGNVFTEISSYLCKSIHQSYASVSTVYNNRRGNMSLITVNMQCYPCIRMIRQPHPVKLKP